LIVALFAIILPLFLAIYFANQEAKAVETQRALAYARDALHRSDMTTDQIDSGIKRLLAIRADDPCSQQSIALMRKIDLASTYIQAIGHLSANTLACSSIAGDETKFDLGAVDVVQPSGVRLRLNVRFPFAEDTTFLVVERDGYAAIIHKALPIDISANENDVSVATFSTGNGAIITSRGNIKPEWVGALQGRSEATMIEDGHVIALTASTHYKIGTLAAFPTHYVDEKTYSLAKVLMPIGLLAGIPLVFSIFYLSRQQTSTRTTLKNALSHNEFFMLYQPVVDLRTNQWVGAEALVRWQRQGQEMVRPDVFIQAAEDSGVIHLITQRVVDLVSADAVGLFERYPDFHLAINLAAADLHSEDTVAIIHRMSVATSAHPNNLIVEATERGLAKPELARETFKQLRSDGIRIAIDDFGTGYSSLSYLESFKLDYLKIDKSFVDTLGTDAPTSNVVHHIIEMAKDMNLEMIAEGVETEAQAQYLREHGVQYAQGWLFAKPMSFAHLVSKLNAQKKAAAALA
jgi:sensor c-di-GMP phosphodiesterase-like protein